MELNGSPDGTNPVDNPSDDNVAANDDDEDGLTNGEELGSMVPIRMILILTEMDCLTDMKFMVVESNPLLNDRL